MNMTANEDRIGAERRLARQIQKLERTNPQGLMAFKHAGLLPPKAKKRRK